jgi:predicted acylesterase/phospholipase RssA
LINNLPCDVMRDLGAGRVIACEVSLDRDETFVCERIPSPWAMLRSRIDLRREPVHFPNLMEVLVRSTMLGSIRREADAIRAADLCLRPPIERFGLLEFAAIHEIARVGYEYTKQRLEDGTETSQCLVPSIAWSAGSRRATTP